MFVVVSRIGTRNHNSPKRFELIAQAHVREFCIMVTSLLIGLLGTDQEDCEKNNENAATLHVARLKKRDDKIKGRR